MPIYAFDCDACGHHFDRLQKLSDPDPDTCPSCGKPAVRRALTAPSFRLKGAGWYETDFKGDKEKKRNLAGDGEGGATSESTPAAEPAKTEAKTEAKPAAAPAPAAD
jgi:putative FmdB family regulatory protein